MMKRTFSFSILGMALATSILCTACDDGEVDAKQQPSPMSGGREGMSYHIVTDKETKCEWIEVTNDYDGSALSFVERKGPDHKQICRK